MNSPLEQFRERHEPFITTMSGKKLDLFDPDPEDIVVEDIVTGLVHNCRFSGQLPLHYSVAAHSMVLCDLMDRSDAQLYALLHDASEAYLVDVPRPAKVLCPQYKDIEERIQQAIIDRLWPYDLPPLSVKRQVHALDQVMPCFEQIALRGRAAPQWAWDTLNEAYTGTSLNTEVEHIVPLIKEMADHCQFFANSRKRFESYLSQFL